jgi:hypothetical protein
MGPRISAVDPPRRRLASSREELVAGASTRTVLDPSDGKSGSSYELVEIDGTRYFLKSVRYRDDWIMRIVHDRVHWSSKLWTAGVYDDMPATIDHTIVAMALEGEGPDAQLSILMTDVGAWLIPEGDDRVSVELNDQLIDHMADLHATFWGWHDELGLADLAHRFRWFSPRNIADELHATEVPVPLAVADRGWRELPDRSPALDALVRAIHDDPRPLAERLRRLPMTFVHGDWKMGNLGARPDGRTILIDCAYPGEAPGCWDLAWYLALNAARLPISKDETIARYREGLETRGIDTAPWWDEQLDLCLVGIIATFAWEKAVGSEDELRWWERRALAASERWLE